MTGVGWLARVLEYWLEEEAWFEAIPIDDGYEDLEASMAMLCLLWVVLLPKICAHDVLGRFDW